VGAEWHRAAFRIGDDMDQDQNGNGLLAEYMTKAELATQLRRSIRSVDRWTLNGDGPPSVRIGKTTFYRWQAVLEWLRSRETAGGTSALHNQSHVQGGSQ
jgi:hypothetical protein